MSALSSRPPLPRRALVSDIEKNYPNGDKGALTMTWAAVFGVTLALLGGPAVRHFDEETVPLKAHLKLKLVDSSEVVFRPDELGEIPVELTFFVKKGASEQKVKVYEIRYELLDKNGEKIDDDALGLRENRVGEIYTSVIVLKDDTTRHTPSLFVWSKYLKDGEQYYLVVYVRNCMALIRFAAKAKKMFQP
jgi:hypothetical protein